MSPMSLELLDIRGVGQEGSPRVSPEERKT